MKSITKTFLIGILLFIFLLTISICLSIGIYNIRDSTFNSADKIESIIKIFTTAGLFFGGFVAAINAYYGAVRSFAMEKTAEAANKNAEAAIDKQITDRFSKAIEQLGSDKIEIRLGAIYTLERIAKNSNNDHWTIMEILTAFVRQNSSVKTHIKKPLLYENSNNQKEKELSKPAIDIQEAMTVIIRRFDIYDRDKILDLSHVNFSQLNLTDAKLAGADLTGANFNRTNLTKAILVGADLIGANLTEANLTEAELEGANFSEANLKNAIFSRALLRGAILKKADLTKAHLAEADFTHANLKEADLTEARLGGANFTRANLSSACFRRADFDQFCYIGIGLIGRAILTEAKIFNADFSENRTIKLEEIKSTIDWNTAKYDREFHNELGLPYY
ncbi:MULTISPECIES: pentapeptide repeat-containing protein [unclassified Nodularia (in: cyanobacteria)]|uniref:pentapeptide repeat-containing protein n=1 Tax=unclassified Nodularia (in: cyanobacteria) TaxID=2656917 RepID=UPI001882697D|nr:MULTISPECIES: pentapeptide repeat-containing protein [unclassified Nodularia (in: cyanobacteria)]MBE9198952.1 pentapeptide repeat-containing protein [Nodularia sp. LEGE 06071]MCC2692731.1 pentapeptide repeat-containing protein [Nodularia sp. LEGE 04288]